MDARRASALPWWLGVSGVLFAILATANAAGYRFGASDQAFYIPVVEHALDPAAFPRDGAMLDAQGRHMLLDEFLAWTIRTTGVPMELLFFAGYLLSLALLWAGLLLIGTRIYDNPWLIAALAAAFTMRHRIPRTSANSFEPYFHPRMLAFALGLLAAAAVLRRRSWSAIALVGVAAIVHITTAMWFAVMLGVALLILDRRVRVLGVAALVAAAIAGTWALSTGAIAEAFAPMDAPWLQALASKDSLFATEWPLWAWAANFAFLGLLWWAHRRRVGAGAATAEDAALVWGATAVTGVFVLTLPLVAYAAALPVQLQISRVFWLVDVVALIYVIDALARARVNPRHLALGLLLFSVVRGGYIMLVERPERALFAVHAVESPWEDAMRWIATQPKDVQVLADPGHAWKYGTSVRAAAARDVFLEEVKDSALAIYSRDVALRVLGRTGAIGDFGALTAERAEALARQYDIDYLVTEAEMPSLPLAYRNARFRVYALSAPLDK